MLAGVCGGVAEYFEFDVTLFRIVYAILTLVTIPVGGFGFISILAYMILAILLPVAPVQAE
jgi:phage shock protein PspC (stress-responsive transcriptional regulator)